MSTTVSIPPIAAQRDIFRLAASMYANTSDVFSTSETQLKMIVCLFVEDGNTEKNYSDIIAAFLAVYKYHISEDEVIAIIKRNKKIFQTRVIDSVELFSLTSDEYTKALESQKKNINSYIDEFIKENGIVDSETFRDAIYKYLYELTTTNINSYRVLLFGKGNAAFSSSELSVNTEDLSDAEKEMVRSFLDWDNDEKNESLGNIVYCCLEYCLLVNGDSPSKLILDTIRKRKVYLDTNIIFRALGINGLSRQKVVIAFLDKCKQARISLVISSHTKKEFKETMRYYADQIIQYPRGSIYLGAYEAISDYSIFSVYEDWQKTHPHLSMKYFLATVDSEYDRLVAQYNIKDDERIPTGIYIADDFKSIRNQYSLEIQHKKQDIKNDYDYGGYTKSSSHDATVVRYIELLRQENDEEDIFLVSSDKILRYWDMTRNHTQYPVVIYPSQLFLILIKLCGRSKNDYDSFVSFINIRSTSRQLSPEKANVIISGISSITEDIQNQKILVSTVFGEEFQNVILHSNTDVELYQNVQTYSQNYLRQQLAKKDTELVAVSAESSEKDMQIQALKSESISKDSLLRSQRAAIAEKDKSLEQQIESLEDKREKVCAFAERKTLPVYIIRWFILPCLNILLIVAYLSFIGLQFFCCEAPWNIATKVSAYIATTQFGQNDGYMLAIDSAVFIILSVAIPKLWRNPWNKEKRHIDKQNRIELYIQRNKLF